MSGLEAFAKDHTPREAWIKKVLKLDLMQLRLEGKALGGKYQGEEKGEGFRNGRREPDGRQQKTKYFSEAEKQKSAVQIEGDGRLSSGGKVLNDKYEEKSFGFVMNPKDGRLHQFELNAKDEVSDPGSVLYQHHSTPLAGAPVAGAGEVKVAKGRLTEINDRSGHYRPEGLMTFQTVRQISLAGMTAEVQGALQGRQPRTKTTPEDPDTLEQLVAAEVGKLRQAYFKDLDAAFMKDMAALADPPAEGADPGAIKAWQQKKFLIEQQRDQLAKNFRDVARDVEAQLTKGQGSSPLVDRARQPDIVPELEELGRVVTAYEQTIAAQKAAQADTTELEKEAQKLRQTIAALGAGARNKETKVKLIGKNAFLDDAEYGPIKSDKDKVNAALVARQLVAPLGEAEYAKLSLIKNAEEREAALRSARLDLGLKNDAPVADLKAALGRKEVARLIAAGGPLDDLIARYGIKTLDADTEKGTDHIGLVAGEKASVTLTASQFLQTGGNEAQIRNKQRVNEADQNFFSQAMADQKARLKHVETKTPADPNPTGGLTEKAAEQDRKRAGTAPAAPGATPPDPEARGQQARAAAIAAALKQFTARPIIAQAKLRADLADSLAGVKAAAHNLNAVRGEARREALAKAWDARLALIRSIPATAGLPELAALGKAAEEAVELCAEAKSSQTEAENLRAEEKKMRDSGETQEARALSRRAGKLEDKAQSAWNEVMKQSSVTPTGDGDGSDEEI